MKFLGICLLSFHFTSAIFNDTIDLGYGFDDHTQYLLGMPKFNFSGLEDHEDPSMTVKKFSAVEHRGTHFDAPYHFNPNGWKVAEVPLDRLIVSGVVINKQEAAAADADTQITVQDLLEWEEANGELPDPVAVIFDFGWAKKYPNITEYFGIVNGNESDIHFPGVSEDAANWLVRTGKVVGVGVDTASIDPGVNKEFMAHRILTDDDIYLMENLALDGVELPARGFQLIVMPMKIVNGTGAPLRIFARPNTPSFTSMIFSWIIHPFVIISKRFK